MIRVRKIELAWSYIIDFENEVNPFIERKNTIEKWKSLAVLDVIENEAVLTGAYQCTNEGLRAKDALHIACAIEAGCQYFITTDDVVLKKMTNKTNSEIRQNGVNALVAALGEIDAERFIALLSREPFDYTEWQRNIFPDLNVHDFSKLAMNLKHKK